MAASDGRRRGTIAGILSYRLNSLAERLNGTENYQNDRQSGDCRLRSAMGKWEALRYEYSGASRDLGKQEKSSGLHVRFVPAIRREGCPTAMRVAISGTAISPSI